MYCRDFGEADHVHKDEQTDRSHDKSTDPTPVPDDDMKNDDLDNTKHSHRNQHGGKDRSGGEARLIRVGLGAEPRKQCHSKDFDFGQ